jgi:hypothetical protein
MDDRGDNTAPHRTTQGPQPSMETAGDAEACEDSLFITHVRGEVIIEMRASVMARVSVGSTSTPFFLQGPSQARVGAQPMPQSTPYIVTAECIHGMSLAATKRVLM